MNEIKLLSQYRSLFVNPPKSRYFVITGGRGSAKSFHVAIFLLNLTYEPNHVILFTRWTLTSANISIIPEFIEKIEMLNRISDFEITQNEIINKRTGSKILFRGIKTSQGTATANLKSISGVTTFIVEEAEELIDQDVFDRIDLSVRAKDIPNRVLLIMNPAFKSHWVYGRWIKEKKPECNYIHTTYLDNKKNLSSSFIAQAERVKGENIHRYEHLFLGKWLDDAEGLLWNRQILDRVKIDTKPEMKRIVVAIDPAVTANLNSDETGIVICSKDSQGFGFVLEDLSGKYSPNEWGAVAVSAVERWNADCIVAEKNQGGDMVETVLRASGAKHRVKLVTATKGKYVRAEPIYSLYEQGKIFHYGNFPILESQMITFDPEKGKSPDRVDALVWGFTELMLGSNFEFSI